MPLFLAGDSTPTIPHIFSKRKDSGFPYGCADAAATDGRRGSNVYKVNQWLWQFGRGKRRMPVGGLTIEETTERKDAGAMHGTSVQQRQYVIARLLLPDSKYTVLYDSLYEYVRVCTSIYAYVLVCTSMYQYNQGLQTLMVCTYLFVIFGSNIQCTVLRRRISAFINNRKSMEGMTKFIHKIKCICLDILRT